MFATAWVLRPRRLQASQRASMSQSRCGEAFTEQVLEQRLHDNSKQTTAQRSCTWNKLPTEVHDLIVSFCDSGRDVAATASTCYASLGSARRRLYRELTYDKKASQRFFRLSWRATEIRSIIKLADTLARNKELASLVCRIHIGRCWPITDANTQRCESAALAVIRVLSTQKQLASMDVDAWDRFWESEPGIAVTSLSICFQHSPEWWESKPRVLDTWMRSALTIAPLKKLRFAATYEANRVVHNRHLAWQTDDTGLVENSTKQQVLCPQSSNVEDLFFGYGTVPTPVIFRHYMSKIKALRYLYVDFCICSRAIWGIDSLSLMARHLEHHVRSIETLCVDLAWGAALTCNPCDLRCFENLSFLRTALDFVFPWKLFTNRHVTPSVQEIREPALVFPTSIETLVLSICHTFVLVRQVPDVGSGTDDESEDEENSEDTVDVPATDDSCLRYKTVSTPEAEALLAWLTDLGCSKRAGLFPRLETIVIQCSDITPWVDWAAMPHVVRFREMMGEAGVDILLE